jgi:hypothetical protein
MHRFGMRGANGAEQQEGNRKQTPHAP